LKDGIFRRFINSLIRALICGIKIAVVNRLWRMFSIFDSAPGSRLGEEPVFALTSHTSLNHRWRLRVWVNASLGVDWLPMLALLKGEFVLEKIRTTTI
jgi:hypothetical protein